MPRCTECNIKFKPKYHFLEKTCQKKECKDAHKAENKPKPIKKVSDKRKKEDQEYKPAREQHLLKNKYCVRCLTFGRYVLADQIHHKNGRTGKRLTDTKFFQSSCDDCHKYIHLNPEESREKGWLI